MRSQRNQWLLNLIAEHGHCSRADALPIEAALITHIQNHLRCGGEVKLTGVGTWSVDWDNRQVVFTPDNELSQIIQS